MAYKPKVLTVPEGGFGVVSHTAYAPICGGVTSQASVQDVAGVGSSGDLYTSNGSGVLPSVKPLANIGNIIYVMTAAGSPNDATVYYMGQGVFTFITLSTVTAMAAGRFFITKSGTINVVYGQITCTPGSSELGTLSIRKNNTTDTNISTSVDLSNATVNFNTTSLGLSVVAGDYISLKFLSPTWATNPTGCRLSAVILIS